MKILLEAAVLIILCILAAIVVPQTLWTCDCTNNPLGDLVAMRSQIELYMIHHNGDLPGTAADVNFVQALTQKTNADGSLNPTGRYGPYMYGPYMPKIPVNNFNGLDTVEIDGVLGGGDYGWHFNSTTGNFHFDTDKHTDR